MASITDRRDGERYYGKTLGSVARRVWGRTAEVRQSPDPNNRVGEDGHMGMITRTDRYGTHVLADVVLRPGDKG